jgi:glycerate kinase
LAAALGAKLSPGFDGVAERLGLEAKLRGCGLCLTGEGRLDEQTLAGKVVAGVARHARAADVPVVVFAGAVQAGPGRNQADLARALGVARIVIVTPPGTPAEQALAQTGENLQRAVAEYVAGQGRNTLSGSGSAL